MTRGYVGLTPKDSRYRPGSMLAITAARAVRRSWLVQTVRPVIRELSDQTNEFSRLYVVEGTWRAGWPSRTAPTPSAFASRPTPRAITRLCRRQGFAMPVRSSGELVGIINVSIPEPRATQEKQDHVVERLREAVDDLVGTLEGFNKVKSPQAKTP